MTPSSRRIHDPSALPPPDFDPIENLDDRTRLEEFWLPSRPDPERESELYEHWREMFSGPLRFVSAKAQPPEPQLPEPQPTVLPMRTDLLSTRVSSPLTTTSFETSSNWSGAYILPNRGSRFVRIIGRWQTPEIKPGAGLDTSALPFRCSVWIGLDGKKRWTTSVPQVGTVHTVSRDGVPDVPKLWWQWWVRDGHSEPHNISGVPIRVGDIVLCSLTVVSLHHVRFHVKNRNTGDLAGFAVYEPTPLRGSSAEWIVEQPADPSHKPAMVNGVRQLDPLFPLPNYGSVLFEHCAAQSATGSSLDRQYHPLRTPRLIRMSQSLAQPTRKAVISLPHRRGEKPNELRVTYRAS